MLNSWRFSSRLAQHGQLSRSERHRWTRANMLLLCILACMPVLLALLDIFTDWDLLLADAVFDLRTKTFPWRHAWLTEVFNHRILKALFTIAGLGFVVAAAWDAIIATRSSWLCRFRLRVVALSAVLVPLTISTLKQLSSSHCPWDLQRYGGSAPYIRLFEMFPAGVEPGQCMPAGHASSALWMISLAVFFVPRRLPHAATVLGIFLAVGFGVGCLQQLRGAHFLSHTLWSMWVALATVFLVTTCCDRWPVPNNTFA